MNLISCMTDVPHPGEFIQEELDARGWSQRDLAYILGVREQAINPIIQGKRGISPEMAKALGEAFDVSAEYFANLQQMYEMACAKEPDPAIARRASLQNVYPIREMIKRDWITDSNAGMLEAQMLRFFRCNSLTDVPYMASAVFKKADYSETNTVQLAWLYRVWHLASEMHVKDYSESKLNDLIFNLPHYTVDPEEVRHVPSLLAECGVRFAIVETLPKANIDGVCFWLDDSSPVVGMTTRHDRIDNFWFVLRHELDHVLHREGRGPLRSETVDLDLEKSEQIGDSLPPEEKRANKTAANFCVPSQELESFYLRKYPFISERDMLGFARRVQRHPGIVVGQLQNKMNRSDWLAKYKVKVREYLVGNSIMDGWGTPVPVDL